MFEHQLISQYDYEYFQEDQWAMRLAGWCSICGIRKVPDTVTEGLLVEALRNDFGGHTFEEVEVALYMYAMRELSPNIEAYDLFNLKFLATVMKEYRAFRKATGNQYEEIRLAIEKPKPREVTDFEKDMMIGQKLWDDYTKILDSGEIFGGASMYDFLERYEFIQTEAQAMLDSIEQGRQWIRHQASTVLDDKDRKKLQSVLEDDKRLTMQAEMMAKDMLYKEWLHNLKVKETTFDRFCDLYEAPIFAKYGEVKIASEE